MRVGLVDYGLGNLPSVAKALERAGASVKPVTGAGELAGVEAVVLPGVGHFGAGARNLRERGLDGPLREWAASGRPLLGICLGLQLLFERSEEDPGARGLGVLEGEVRRLRPPPGFKVPHMGWNTVEVQGEPAVVGVLSPGDMVYFVHSFYVEPARGAAGVTEYGVRFCTAVEQDGVVGVQFHPEKSGAVGRRLLRAFLSRAGGGGAAVAGGAGACSR